MTDSARIVYQLRSGPLTSGELAAVLDRSARVISAHLSQMVRVGRVRVQAKVPRIDGRGTAHLYELVRKRTPTYTDGSRRADYLREVGREEPA